MKNEIYYWIALIVIILAAAVYFRFFYAQALQLSMHLNETTTSNIASVYPYQRVTISETLANTGSAEISDVGIEVLLNGNQTYVYGVTVPVGKQATIDYNYTPTTAGVYNVTFIADPNRLYNIANRSDTKQTVSFTVNKTAPSQTYSEIPSNGILQSGSATFGISGLVFSDYIAGTYNLSSFNLSTVQPINNFLEPVVDLAEGDLINVDETYAIYHNHSVTSIWMDGYVLPSLMRVAARGRSFPTENVTVNGKQVTIVNITNNTSFCSWYQGGWIKSVTVQGVGSCLGVLQSNGSFLQAPVSFNINNKTSMTGTDVIANYTTLTPNGNTIGELEFIQNTSLLYAGITTNAGVNTLCYGSISNFSNVSYCSDYFFPVNTEKVGPLSMIRTRAYVNDYNLTVFSLVNTTRVLSQVPINEQLLKNFGIKGRSEAFQSALANNCRFVDLKCSNITFVDQNVSFSLTNNRTYPLTLQNLGCSWYGTAAKLVNINKTLGSNQTLTLKAPCYSNNVPINALSFGTTLSLVLNLTSTQSGHETQIGTAFIV